MLRDSINPDQAKLDKIRLWPQPVNSTGLASFLYLCNYYSDLISLFAHISDALYKVSRADEILGLGPSSPNSKKSSDSCSSPESCGYLTPSVPSFS